MLALHELELQYITDETGEKTAVILSMAQFQQLLDDIADLAAVAERREEPSISHEDLVAGLKQDGLL